MDYFLFDFSGVQFHYTMNHNIIFLAFPAHIVITHTPAGKANLQAGAAQPCLPAIRNHLICAKSK